MSPSVDNTQKSSKRFENCFICFFRPVLRFGYTGITALNFECDHSKRPFHTSLKRSWLATSIAFLLSAFFFTVGSHNAYTVYGTNISSRDDVLLVGAVMINSIAAYLFLFGVVKTKAKIREIDGLSEIVKDSERMKIIFLDEPFVRKAHKLVHVLIAMFVSLQVFTVLMFVFIGDYSLKAFKKLCTDTCVFMQGTVGSHYVLLQLVLLHMFQKVSAEIREACENRLNRQASCKQQFLTKIQQLGRLYESVYLNFVETDKFQSPAFLVWWNIVLLVNTLATYIIIVSILIREPLDITQLLFTLKVCGCLVGIIIYLVEMEITAAVVSQSMLNSGPLIYLDFFVNINLRTLNVRY